MIENVDTGFDDVSFNSGAVHKVCLFVDEHPEEEPETQVRKREDEDKRRKQ